MLHVLFTSDHEIHGNGDGCPRALMVEPTDRMMDLLERHGAKLTIMADVAEILKFREYRDQTGLDDYHYGAIAAQLQDAIRRGHDVQLHLHASYFNARHEKGRWLQDWSEYDFAGLSPARLDEIVRLGKNYLEELLQQISLAYRCCAFRAANWSMSPSGNVIRALLDNGITIDSSVFKYGRREGIVNFDYTEAESHYAAWFASKDDICRRDERGRLLEVPIYTENRWIGAFLSRNRLERAAMTRAHRIPSSAFPARPVANTRGRSLRDRLGLLTRRHAWKADFNQCTGRQLIGALNRAAAAHGTNEKPESFVLIGHSKLFTLANERSLRPFLHFVARHPDKFRFGVFGDSLTPAPTSLQAQNPA